MAICYESLLPEHAAAAAGQGADLYLASVAKPAGGMARAVVHYPAMARAHGMFVLMVNSIGPSDTFVSVGQSAAWDDRGDLLAQMDEGSEGLVVLDTERRVAVVKGAEKKTL